MSDPITVVGLPVRLEYTVTAGANLTRYLRALEKKRVIGARCGTCSKVYVPPRGACPTCGVPTEDEVQVEDRGVVTTFCVINIPFGNMPFDPPYVAAAVLLNGADIPIFHLVRGVAVDEVRMGMKVRAEWVPDEELAPTLQNIKWFEPTGEPDAEYETYQEHL
jgi:hypothetical protein